MKVVANISIEVEILGAYRPSAPDSRLLDGTYAPGDGAAVDGMRVFMTRGAKRLDITALLTDTQLRMLEEDAIELHLAATSL